MAHTSFRPSRLPALLAGSAVALASSVAQARTPPLSPGDDPPPPAEDPALTLSMPEVSTVTATSAGVPDTEPAPSRDMSSWLSLGLRSGYGSPLGSLAFVMDYRPVPWFGLEGAAAPPAFGEPSTLAESLFFAWKQADWLEQGLGIGVAQSFITDVEPGGHAGVVNYLTADCAHLEIHFTRNLSLRTSLDLTFPLNGGGFCGAHPEACPRVTGIAGNGALLWSFDLSGGRS